MKNIAFRFFFIFFLFTISPWYFLYDLPGVSYIIDAIYTAEAWVVELFNKHFLQVKDTLNANGGGSGDTSFAWAQFYTFFILALLGCVAWSLIDRKRLNKYKTLEFWLSNLIRYYLSLVSLSYGIIKLFALQMPFPNLSQLATPLGDFLPMRLSWMFIGYSTQYQIFSGVMETIVGILLLNRKTVTLGALLGIGVFSNVFMLNLSYDVPVKLYSMQLLIYSIFLTIRDWKRLTNFFLLNKAAEPTDLYNIDLNNKWQKIARVAFKIGFVILFALIPLNESWSRYKEESKKGELKPIKIGVYNIQSLIKNNDTIDISHNDKMAWKDFIFDKGGLGSINTLDTLFRQRYGRGYFNYQPDSVTETILFKKSQTDTTSLFKMNYKIVNENTLLVWGLIGTDSLRFELQRSNRHFQLAERQFHWISESNR
jgi:hypothetical protein